MKLTEAAVADRVKLATEKWDSEADAEGLLRREGLSGSSAALLRAAPGSSGPPLLRGAALLSRLPAESFLAAIPPLLFPGALWLSSPLSDAVSGPSDEASSPSACKRRGLQWVPEEVRRHCHLQDRCLTLSGLRH